MGCTSDPWQGAPPRPATVQHTLHYAIEIEGRTVGHEERSLGSDGDATVMVRRRTWSLVLDGQTRRVLGASRLTHRDGLVGHYQRWSVDSARTWSGQAWMPDALPPPASGLRPVLDPWTLTVEPVHVTVQDGLVAWTGSGGPAQATFDETGLVRAAQGAIRVRRVDAPPAQLEPFDPVSLLVVPVSPQAGARRSLVGRFTVDGRPLRVDAPLWMEVPALALPEPPSDADPDLAQRASEAIGDAIEQRKAVERLVAYVRANLEQQVTPGSLDATEALRAGRGDCDEAAAVFVALADAVGLEARAVGGLVYADGAMGPGLYPHAWATVRIGGREVPVDPGLGQAPADASHVPLGGSAAEAAARLTSGASVRIVELR